MFSLALLYGFLAGCAGLLLQAVLLIMFGDEQTLLSPGVLFIIGAASVEEIMKLAFLLQYAKRITGDLRWVHVFIFGLGFAATEIVLAFFLGANSLPTQDHWLALLLNAGLHILTTLILALGIRFLGFRRILWLALLSAVILIHSGYNIMRLVMMD